MNPRRNTAVAIALLLAAVVAAGCGFGPGDRLGEATLTITRDYGRTAVVPPIADDVSESDSVMRVLERNAKIATRYGGGFVQSIAGLEGEERAGRYFDWFYYVNGVEATVGAADYKLQGGDAVWWDYRDWGTAMRVPAVVGSWPQPFTDGYDGRKRPVEVRCLGGGSSCGLVRARLQDAGAVLSPVVAKGAIQVLVGPWARLRTDAGAALVDGGPQASGIFARFSRSGNDFALQGLRADGTPGRSFAASTGLVAATRRNEDPPVWLVTGGTAAAVKNAAVALDEEDLKDRYAVAAQAGKAIGLPLP